MSFVMEKFISYAHLVQRCKFFQFSGTFGEDAFGV